MKTLIIGAGPLGSLYTHLFHKSGKDVTLLARGAHYDFIEKNGLSLINEFTGEKIVEKVKVIDRLHSEDEYDLVIVLMRKNCVLKLLPDLSQHKYLNHILFMGNNANGFNEYLKYLPKEKILFGFPGGGGSRLDHVAHYIDSEKPGGARMPVTIGELDGKTRDRTTKIQELFESSDVPVKIVDDIDSWLKYHVAFILPVAGALLKSGDNYKLAKDQATIKQYIMAVREGGKALKSLGYTKSYNPKQNLFSLFPKWLLVRILSKVFDSKFAEVAMMMHVNSAKDEMAELTKEFRTLQKQSGVATPTFDSLMDNVSPRKVEELEKFGAGLEMPKDAVKEQGRIMFKALKKKFGFWGMIGVFADMFLIEFRLRKNNPETKKKALQISKVIEKELFTFSALYLALARRLGREEAYDFFKTEVMYKIAKTSMALIYQVKDLKQCEGDVFDNFKKMNIAMFERLTKDKTWIMEDYKDEPDKLTIKVVSCANVELFTEVGAPELGMFGCDHDVAGYPNIEDDVNCDFRRFCTLAKGSDHCLFEFYRKGTAPHNANLNV
jgi:2-dehydropantoate 2-reductase